MLATALLVFIAGVVCALAAMRFVAAVGKLASRTPDTHNTHESTRRCDIRRQDKPPLVFWAVASPVIAAAFVILAIFSL